VIYLDNSATTPLDPDVVRKMNAYRDRNFANAGSVHQLGQRARVEMELARDAIVGILKAEPRELIFTSGGTEANNHALKGYAFRIHQETGSWPPILTNSIEHHAVLHPVAFLARFGVPVHYVPVDREGRVLPEALKQTLAGLPPGSPPLVSIMYANNEVGTVNPVAELAGTVHEAGGLFHVDAVQAFGKLPVDVSALGVDMMTISAHKIHGPKGVGALYVNRELELESLMHGGAQERDRRGGTEPVELMVGFAEAARIGARECEAAVAYMVGLREALWGELSSIDGIVRVTAEESTLPNILNVTFEDAADLDGEGLIVGMDLRGFAVSNGSACTSGSMQPSHVLLGMGYPPAQARSAVRFSLSRFNSKDGVLKAADALREVVAAMRR